MQASTLAFLCDCSSFSILCKLLD